MDGGSDPSKGLYIPMTTQAQEKCALCPWLDRESNPQSQCLSGWWQYVQLLWWFSSVTSSFRISRSVIPVVYIKSTVDQWSEKWQSKHNYVCKYNNLPTTCFGRDWPSSGWDTTSEELYIYCKCRYGGMRSRLQTYGACGRIGVGTSPICL